LVILANLGIHHDQLLSVFLDVDEYLQSKDDYRSFFRYGKKTRYFHIILILATYYMSASDELTVSIIVAI